MARPSKAPEWLEREKLILLQGWARDGCTDEMLAERIGISLTTLYEWKRRYPQFTDAIKKGKEVVDYAVENALLANALGGNVVAQIFWLKNRKPEKWRDHPENTMATDSDERIKDWLDVVKGTADEVAELFARDDDPDSVYELEPDEGDDE